MATEIATLISSIPKEFWTVVLSAGGAWLVADFTTRRNNKHALAMQENKQEYDADQAEMNRRMSLRKELYIPAITAANQIPAILGNYLNPEISDVDCTASMVEASKAIAAVSAITSGDTHQRVADYSYHVGLLSSKQSAARIRIKIAHSSLESAAGLARKQLQDGTALTELMKSYNLNGENQQKWAALRAQWELHENILKQLEDNRRAALARYKDVAISALHSYVDDMDEYFRLQNAALAALRSDLGVGSDPASYEANRQRAMIAIRKMADDMVAAVEGEGNQSA